MHKTLKILQLNVRKQQPIQQSLLNDEQLKDYGALAVTEPHARRINGQLVTSPMGHPNWTKMTPTEIREAGWPCRSMLWVRRDIEAEQIPVRSADLTAAKLHLPDRTIIMVSVYVEPNNPRALRETTTTLDELIRRSRCERGVRTDVILAGDFNRHDQLWGGDDVSLRRQGEANPIIDLMNEHSLCSLLPRGTKTWQGHGGETTIDLVLASAELSADMIKCAIHATEHGSDHRAIETIFEVAVPERAVEQRLLFKNAPWTDIRTRITTNLRDTPQGGSVQQQTDRLMAAVLEAVHALTPKAKPSPYAKRWWTADLTQLRKIYTYWRNQARQMRRIGQIQADLERRAREASKEYHDAIRKQKQTHWNDFLADKANIWQAARYLKEGGGLGGDRIPPLKKTDGSTTREKEEQAQELLDTFFPPLPPNIEEEGERPRRTPVFMPDLTMEEIEEKVFAAKPRKAPGNDGLPAEVWKQVWPAVKDRVLQLFRKSLNDGALPTQWKSAKIIPLKKPGKDDYSQARTWRPISLLSTLGKILEAVIAERISYAVETFGLLPTNHFGARKSRSAEQALLLLQEHIHNAWRSRKVLSLVSFDVKGAYNGVCKDRLLQRLAARGIPEQMVRWIDAFCSNRTATILVNGYTSPQQALPQAGLPQGSPLSPILFLFFNADLVQHKLSAKEGAMAFLDDYTAWVTGPTAEANRSGIQDIIDKALAWGARSGATFEGDKTTVLHFTRNKSLTSTTPFTIQGQTVQPKGSAKILGVIVDTELRYREHLARAATRGLRAAMALKRLRTLSPTTARLLYVSTVAPVMDYASNVWVHRVQTGPPPEMNRVQNIGAQAITGSFRTVATAVAEAEASIQTIQLRLSKRATSLWTCLRTLPDTNPLSRLGLRYFRRFTSPLERIGHAQQTQMDRMERILPIAMAPWDDRLQAARETDREKATETANNAEGIVIATSASAKHDKVGIGVVIRDTAVHGRHEVAMTFSAMLGAETEQNPYYAELAAIATALSSISDHTQHRQIEVLTSNQSALAAISRPKQQSGQSNIRKIHQAARLLKGRGNSVALHWAPAREDIELARKAKTAAQGATQQDPNPQTRPDQARTTVRDVIIARQQQNRTIPKEVGAYSRKIDTALPGRHTRTLYDNLNRKEASVLAQLRTGMTRLNGYLHRIRAVESDMCECGQSSETVKHFLFCCTKWTTQRRYLSQQTETKMGNLSFFLGGKEATDQDSWKPNMNAVRATIKYAIATGRLEREAEGQGSRVL